MMAGGGTDSVADEPVQQEKGYSPWVWIGGIVVLIIAVSQCATEPTTSPTPSLWVSGAATDDASDAATPPPAMSDQRAVDLKAGTKAYAKAAAVDDLAATMVFSKNCYAALDAKFTWNKLDQCGAFDAAAASDILAERVSGDSSSAEYLSEESAAQRFIGSGTAHGADAGAMDVRWDKTKRDAENLVLLARPKPKPTPTTSSSEEDYYYVDENGNLQTPTGE